MRHRLPQQVAAEHLVASERGSSRAKATTKRERFDVKAKRNQFSEAVSWAAQSRLPNSAQRSNRENTLAGNWRYDYPPTPPPPPNIRSRWIMGPPFVYIIGHIFNTSNILNKDISQQKYILCTSWIATALGFERIARTKRPW